MAYEGKRSAGTKKKSKLFLVIGILLLVIAAAGLILFFAAGRQMPEKVANTPQETMVQDDVIQTPFGALSYPGMWTDKVEHKTEEDGEDFRIVFRSTIKNAETVLFTLCYGTVPEDGYVMGQMDDVTVSVVMNAIEPDAAPSEEILNELYALQESVNDLLVQLRENPAFIPA